MAAPTTGIIDNFNRANGTLNSGDWSTATGLGPAGPLEISSNRLVKGSAGAYDASYWDTTTFGPDCEIYLTLAAVGAANLYVGLYLRLQAAPTSSGNVDGYRASFEDTTDTWRIFKMTDGGETHLGGVSYSYDPTVAGSIGDRFGLVAVGDTLKFYTDEGSGWVERLSVADSTYSAGGYVAVDIYDPSNAFQWDDLGGGTLPAFPTVAVLDSFNRANETPVVETNWEHPAFAGNGAFDIIDNTLGTTLGAGWRSMYWEAATYGPDSEAFITTGLNVDDINGVELLARIVEPQTTGIDGYFLHIEPAAGTWAIYRVNNDAQTQVTPSGATQVLSPGDAIGLRVTGTGATVTLRGFYRPSGGAWRQHMVVADTSGNRITGSGYIGIASNLAVDVELDDFGGGTLAELPTGPTPPFLSVTVG